MKGPKQYGRFIAFEGGEGTGKSTQARMLAQALKNRGLSVEVTREPGGTPGAEAIREMLLHPPGEGWGARAEALLFAAARSDHAQRLIRPALLSGAWVVCDRFVDSSRAYQGGAGRLGDEAITRLHNFGSEGLRPDRVILLEVDEERLAKRLEERDGGDSDAIGGRGADYHRAVAARFRELAKGDPGGFSLIDGNADPDEVHARVLEVLAPMIEAQA